MTPAVRCLCAVDVRSMVEWISAIPFEEWPQQTPLEDGQLRPAMVNDPVWPKSPWPWSAASGRRPEAFLSAMAETVFEIRNQMGRSEPMRLGNYMLSAVMPRHSIPAHADQQSPDWLTRVHVPLLTNPWAFFDEVEPERRRHQMEVGSAYLVDVTRVHEVHNNGPTPRVHFMFDVFGGGP